MYSISNLLVTFLMKNASFSFEHKDWCVYALEKKLYKLLSFILVVVISSFFKVPIESTLVFIFANFLRTRISGWHAESPLICILATIITSVGGGFFAKLLNPFLWQSYFVLLIGNALLIAFSTQVNNSHLHLSVTELKKNKRLGFNRLLLSVTISVLLFLFAPTRILSVSVLIGCSIALISTFIRQKEDVIRNQEFVMQNDVKGDEKNGKN